MAKRKRSAKQRRFFGRARAATRTVYRTVKKRARRAYRAGRSSGWLPLSPRETLVAAGTGFTAPIVMSYVRPYSDNWLGFAGDYKDEAAMAIVGTLAHRFAPSGVLKDMGKEYFRLAAISAGGQLGSRFNNGTNAVTGSGVVMA